MNPRVYWTFAVGGGAVALWLAQMGFRAQDRQYEKTLKYVYGSRERAAARMQQRPESK